jgi:hypothetical protein
MMMNPYPADPSQQQQQPQQPQNTVGQPATMAPGQNPLSYQQAMAQALQNSGNVAASAPNLSGVMQMMQMMKKPAAAPGTPGAPVDQAAPGAAPFTYPQKMFNA